MKTSFKGRALALLAGCAFAAGGLTILLDKDLAAPANWSSLQWLTILMVFGTIAAGHLMADAARARHVFAALGFLVLFLSGTGLVVYSSVGRQVEAAGTTSLSVEDTNNKIVEKSAELEKAKARRDYADKAADREMTGQRCGTRCKDWKQNSKDITVVIKQLEGEIAALGPQKPVNAQATAFAEIGALFGFDNRARTVAILTLICPLLKTLFFEIGAIVSLGFGFRGGKRKVLVAANDCRTVSDDFQPETVPPMPPGGRKVKKRLPANVVALHPVVEALESNGGSVSSNQELAQLMGVTEGEASKRWQEIRWQLKLERQGKQLRIALRA